MKKIKLFVPLAYYLLVVILAAGTLVACGKDEVSKNNIAEASSAKNKEETKTGDVKGTEDNEEKLTVRIAYNGGVGSAGDVGFNVALLTGYLEEQLAQYNATVEISSFANGPAVNEAFVAGNIDIVNSMGDQPLVVGISNDIDVTTIGTIGASARNLGLVVAPDSDITSVEQLKGKRVTTFVGTNNHKALLQVLADAELTENDVELVNVSDNDAAIAALSAGEVDAAWVTGVAFITAEDNGAGKIITDLSEYPTYIYIQATESFTEEHPEIVETYLDAIKWGEEYFKENPEESYQLIADYFEISKEDAKIYIDYFDWGLGWSEAAVQDLYETNIFLVEHELLTNEISKETIDEYISDFAKGLGE